MNLRRTLVPVAVVTAGVIAGTASLIGGGGAVAAAPTVAAPGALGFAPKIVLGPDVGGEPSIQDDGRGNIYVTSPTGIASALVNSLGALKVNSATGGGALWRSLDGGQTFQNPNTPIFFGTKNGGGDTDVTADSAGKLYTADLEAAAADVQSSTDRGTTLTAPAQAGPDNDREWLTPLTFGGAQKLFLTYHDFAVNVDIVLVSTDGGTTFLPAGLAGKIINPLDNPTAAADCFNGNLISKPVTDAQGGLYILLNCAKAPGSLLPTGAPLNRLYLAISRDGGATFTTTQVADVSTTSGAFGRVFNQLGIDAGGNLYVAAAGTLGSTDAAPHIYLYRSLDNGKSWKAPITLDSGRANNAQVFPAIAAGQAGQVAVGYYGTTVCQMNTQCNVRDNRGDGNIFQFFITQTLNAADAAPALTTTQVTMTSPHQNGICTDGLFCGTPLSSGGNRNLADFESMTVDPAGHIELVIPADPLNVKTTDFNPTVNWFFKETSGPLMPPGATNGNGTGNQTYVRSALTTAATPTPSAAAAPSATPTAAAPLSTTPNTSAVTPGGRAALTAGIAVLAALLFGIREGRRRRARHQ